MNEVGWHASLSLAHGRAESSRGRMWVQRPLTVPSRTPDKSLASAHSQRKTRPVMTTSSTRIPSPETCSVSRVEFPAWKEEHMEDHRSHNWRGGQRKNLSVKPETRTLNGRDHLSYFWHCCGRLQYIPVSVPQEQLSWRQESTQPQAWEEQEETVAHSQHG